MPLSAPTYLISITIIDAFIKDFFMFGSLFAKVKNFSNVIMS